MASKYYPAPSKQMESHQTYHHYPMPPDPQYYIYFYHTKDYIILPTYPEIISDLESVNYNEQSILGRSAPLQAYQGSGPRTLQFSFELHRDMMWEINYQNTTLDTNKTMDDDYVETMIRKIQSAALPEYSVSEKMINPPMVAVRIGEEVFIKGVVVGSVGVVYAPPILSNGKFAQVKIQFAVTEITPYSASAAMELGSFRDTGYSLMTNKLYGRSNTASGSTRATTNSSGIWNEGTAGG